MREWLEIEEFPGYEVSDDGNVRNANTNRILSQVLVNGKLTVSVKKERRTHILYVHREVARAFINPEIDGVIVKFVDGDSSNCRASNLNVTPLKAVKPGKNGTKVMILETKKVYDSVQECANAIGGNTTGIYGVLNKRSYTYRGYHFRYVS